MNRHHRRSGDRVLEVLGLFGDVEWARFSLGDDEPTLPVAVWRFAEESNSQAHALADLIREHAGSDWQLVRRGRNWTLWPSVLAAEFATGRWRTDTEASISLATSDPELEVRLKEGFWRLVGILEGEDV